jgi:hypothetical protein
VHYISPYKSPFLFLTALFSILFTASINQAYGQVQVPADSVKADSLRIKEKTVQPVKATDTLYKQYDFGDLVRNILHPGRPADAPGKKSSGITVIPNMASNPTIGSQIGIKAVAGKKLGNDPSTLLSVAATSASITTKGIIYFYINHNIYTPGNNWNFQGNLVAAKTVSPDYGLGIGQASTAAKPTRYWPIPSVKAGPCIRNIIISGRRYTKK